MRRWSKYLAWTAFLLLIIAAAAYVFARVGLKELDGDARDELGGLYLQTEQGVLSYTREGNSGAPAIILVHGFSTPKVCVGAGNTLFAGSGLSGNHLRPFWPWFF